MANKIPLALERLVSAIKSSKTVFFTPVYTTFLQLPDEYLNSHQKLVCIALMQLGQATRVLDQIKLEDSQFQLSAGKIAELTGLSRSQSNRALKTLPNSLNILKRRKMFKAGELVTFKIMDSSGAEISGNNSGLAPYFFFEYTAPNNKISLGGKVTKDVKPKPAKKQTEIPFNENPDFDLKMRQLKVLGKYFSDSELEVFTGHSLIEIVKTVDYYLSALYVKQQQSGSGAILNYGWLKKAFNEYKIALAPEKEKVLKAVSYIQNLHTEILRIIGRKELNIDFKLIQTAGPQFCFNDFVNVPRLQEFFESQLTKLSSAEKTKLSELCSRIHKSLIPVFKKNSVPEESQISHIKYAVINKHFNLL